ncbi:MAG TPA: ABC transporter substrate-binding protein, partial [Longibacter sp.]
VFFKHTDTDPDDALTAAIFDATVPCFTHDFSMTGRYYEQLEAWMVQRGLVDRPEAPVSYWTNDLALPSVVAPSVA